LISERLLRVDHRPSELAPKLRRAAVVLPPVHIALCDRCEWWKHGVLRSPAGYLMPFFRNAGTGLYFEVHGDGRPLVFLHGGTVDFRANYAAFGWPERFLAQGFQIVGLDFRGHGQSDKPHDRGSYGTPNVAGDVISLLDHLHLDRVDLIAYSIGTAMALHMLQSVPARVGRVALVATGDGLVGLPPHEFSRILPALAVVADRSEYPQDLPKHVAAYWRFIEASGGDRRALKAFAEAAYPPLSVTEAQAITHPVLVISGENDHVLGRGSRLASALGNARYLEVAGADHFSLAADETVQDAVSDFLHSEH
jgi:pimeloyl-ACP methyl ester carboxylesterase